MSDPDAGWYQDPADASRERWWDGHRWTEQHRASSSTPAAPPNQDPWNAPTTVGTGPDTGWNPTGPSGTGPGPQPGMPPAPSEAPGAVPPPPGGPSHGGFGPVGGPPPPSGAAGTSWPQQPVNTSWQHPQGAPPGASPGQPVWGAAPPPPPPGGGSKAPWIIGGAVALLVVLCLLGVGVFYLTDGGTSTTPTTRATATTTPFTTRKPPVPVPPTSGSPTSGSARSDNPVEPTTRLSYTRIGPPWIDNTGSGNPAGKATAGERTVTQAQTPKGGAYVAEIQLFPHFPASSNPDPAESAKSLLEQFTAPNTGVYPDPHQQAETENRPLPVSGKKGHLIKGRATFDVPGYEAKAESYAIVVVNTDQGQGCAFISIPENRPDLLPVIDRVITSLTIAP